MSTTMRKGHEALVRKWKDEVGLALIRKKRPKILRAQVPVDETDLLAWLEAQDHDVKTYWCEREGAFAVAGLSAAKVYKHQAPKDLNRLFKKLHADLSSKYPGLRYYGGLRFDRAKPKKGRWNEFGAHYFVVPEIELGRRGEQYYLAYNAAVPGKPDRAALMEGLHGALDSLALSHEQDSRGVSPLNSRSDMPGHDEWLELVDAVLGKFKANGLRKVVLARESFFEFGEKLDPVALLRGLVSRTTHSYDYCFQMAPNLGFIGASPERLYKRQSSYIQSEALAGTRPCGGTPDEDAALGQELLDTEKEILEHRYVLDSLHSFFDKHCEAVRGGDKTELLILRHCQHLITRLEGMLKNPDSDGAILDDIHPTPAVGGVPTDAAIRLIGLAEPFERGWYAGPVGWVGYDATEFAVAIRSGLVKDNTLSLYSGAGIVPGSKPEEEWAEIENKMTNFLGIFKARA